MAWNDNYVCGTPYLSKHASFDCVFCYASLKWWHSRWFVHFLQILVFSVVSVGGWGGQKILSRSVSLELYLIWLCFLVHMCKMMISSVIFLIFSKVWLSWFFKIHQWMAKGNSKVCPIFFTCVWFHKNARYNWSFFFTHPSNLASFLHVFTQFSFILLLIINFC